MIESNARNFAIFYFILGPFSATKVVALMPSRLQSFEEGTLQSYVEEKLISAKRPAYQLPAC